jgi:hypothetical protein
MALYFEENPEAYCVIAQHSIGITNRVVKRSDLVAKFYELGECSIKDVLSIKMTQLEFTKRQPTALCWTSTSQLGVKDAFGSSFECALWLTILILYTWSNSHYLAMKIWARGGSYYLTCINMRISRCHLF